MNLFFKHNASKNCKNSKLCYSGKILRCILVSTLLSGTRRLLPLVGLRSLQEHAQRAGRYSPHCGKQGQKGGGGG